jgi:hypothetical protein
MGDRRNTTWASIDYWVRQFHIMLLTYPLGELLRNPITGRDVIGV